MSAQLLAVDTVTRLPVAVDPIALLPEFARAQAVQRLATIRPAIDRVRMGVSIRAAAQWLCSTRSGGESAPTIERWLTAYQRGGLAELAPKYTGRQRKEYGWEAKAVELYARPTRPAYSTVALWLREQHGHPSATEHLVRRYLQSLPSHVTETSPKRLGAHYYAQNVRPHIVRDSTVLPVGSVYEGDGHCCDVYVANPATGNAYRPEITVWLDVRSHYVVGWYLSDRESANTTLFSLSHALLKHDHVPSFVHSDPGPGFVAKTIVDDETGFLARFAIKPITALPGNAKGKGLVEGFFRWFEERCGKQFETYCQARTDDALSRMRDKIRRGELQLPTLSQYVDAITAYMDFYNRNPQPSLGALAPCELWAQLQRVPLEIREAAVMRPRVGRTVRRWGVALHNRIYRANALAAYEGRAVKVEYDLHDDSRVWICDAKDRRVCEAPLVEKRPWMPDSRIEEQEQKRLEGQRQRKLNDIAELEARAAQPIGLGYSREALLGTDACAEIAAAPAALEAPRPARIDLAELALAASIAADAAPVREERPVDRFARALRLRDQLNGGLPMDPEDARWLSVYASSAECISQAEMYETFGSLPGLHNAEAPAATGATDHTTNHH